MILAPGRNAIHLDVPVLPPLRAAAALLLVPLCMGVTAQRFLGDVRTSRAYPALAMGSLHRVDARASAVRRIHREPQPLRAATKPTTLPVATHVSARPPAGPPLPPEQPRFGETTLRALMTAVRPPDSQIQAATLVPQLPNGGGFSGPFAGDVISVKSILKAISVRRRSISDVEPNQVPINGVLRIQALHLDETLSTRPFDDLLRPDARAFADVNHLMRCRVTGHEVQMDPKLVAILSQLSTHYGRTLQLISGHRAPHANGTSETSQHTLGRAADIRIPGVSIAELKKVAIKLGARGVGLYPEKGFVHVDVRDKNRYFWIWTARGGEQADMGWAPPRATRHSHADSAAVSEEGGEQGDQGATAPELDAHDHQAEAEMELPSAAAAAVVEESAQ
jgi:uncharacterized protein YcbK (DUF882 family)